MNPKHWVKLKSWLLEEAVLLAFGYNPKVILWREIRKFIDNPHDYPAVKPIAELWELATRAHHDGRFSQENDSGISAKVHPAEFIAWCQEMGIENLSVDLIEAVELQTESIHNREEPVSDETPEKRRERLESWYKEETRLGGKRGALTRTAKREDISRTRVSQILKRKKLSD